MLRILLPLTLAVAAGCTAEPSVGDIQDELRLARSAELKLSVDGHARLTTPESGIQITVLDPATLDDLHAKVNAAQFARLAPSYVCTGLCPSIASIFHHITVQLDQGPVTVVVDEFYASAHPDRVPAALVEVIHSLNVIIYRSDWH